jgi:hypothetical protein
MMLCLVPAFSLLGFSVKNKRVRKVRDRRLHHNISPLLSSPSQIPHQNYSIEAKERKGKENKSG